MVPSSRSHLLRWLLGCGVAEQMPNPSTRTSPFLPSRLLNFLWLFGVPPTKVDAVVKVQGDRKQTAHLQTALLHPVGWRTQIRTAQPGSIPSTWLGAESATQG